MWAIPVIILVVFDGTGEKQLFSSILLMLQVYNVDKLMECRLQVVNGARVAGKYLIPST
jgi:hypothetical protein